MFYLKSQRARQLINVYDNVQKRFTDIRIQIGEHITKLINIGRQ